MGFVIFLFILAAAFGLWGAISPQHMWRVTQSWRYKNPEANRPSEAQHTVTRVGSVFAMIVAVVLIPITVSAFEHAEEESKQEQYDDCLAEHRDTDGLLSAEDWCEDLEPGSGPDQ